MRKKNSFCLLEILIVICIVALISSLFCIKTYKMVNHYKFKSNVNDFLDMMSFLKKNAVLREKDTFVVFQQVENGIICISDERMMNKRMLKDLYMNIQSFSVSITNTGRYDLSSNEIIFFDKGATYNKKIELKSL